MKKLLIFCSMLITWLIGYGHEVTIQDAVDFILSIVDSKDGKDIWVGEPNATEYLVILDPTPLANWGHEVTYYYVAKETNENAITINKVETHSFLPDIQIEKIYSGTSMAKTLEPVLIHSVPKRNVPEASHQYAIILNGGLNKNNNPYRYYNDCSYIYKVLRRYYNVPKSNIYPVMSDGTDPGLDQFTQSQNLDLDDDDVADIEYAATLSDLETVFNLLKHKITKNDHLLFYVTDHGGYDEDLQSSYICLWGEDELLYPNQLNEYFNMLDVGSITCVFGQCNSGGFIEPLAGNNRIILAACGEQEYSYGISVQSYDAFVDAWTTSLLNVDKYWNESVLCADANGDDYVSMYESYLFAEENDVKGPYGENLETPEFYCEDDVLADDLCMNRHPHNFELYIRDNLNDLGIEPNMEMYINNSPDIWVRNAQDGKTGHQIPKLTSPGSVENYVYVRVKNRGVFDYNPSEERMYLHLYWAKCAPAHKYTSYSGQFLDSTNNRVGNAIQSVLLSDRIAAGDEIVICIPWKTPSYSAALTGEPLSLMAYISDQPYGLVSDAIRGYFPKMTYSNPAVDNRNYKKIAIKSACTPYKLTQTEWETPLYLQNLQNSKQAYSVQIVSGNSVNLYEKVKLKLILPNGLYQTQMQKSSNLNHANSPQRVVINDVSEHEFTSESKVIKYLPLEPDQFAKLTISAVPIEKVFTGDLYAIVVIREYPTDEIVGTYTINFSLNRGKFTTKATYVSVNSLGNDNYELRFVGSEDKNFENIEWQDLNGNVLSTNNNFVINSGDSNSILAKAEVDGEFISELIQLDNSIKISNINRVAQTSSLIVETNKKTQSDLTIRVTSVVNPTLSTSRVLKEGESIANLSTYLMDSDIVVVTLEANGVILDSKIFR